MVSLFLLFFFLLLFWVVTRALLWVFYYFIIYLLVAHVAYFALGNAVDFNGPVTFWVSRVIFLLAALWLGGWLRRLLAKSPLLTLFLAVAAILLVLFFWWQPLPSEFFYYQPSVPGEYI